MANNYKSFLVFLKATITLVLILGTSLSLMNIVGRIIEWNSTLGSVVNWWGLYFHEPLKIRISPIANWLNWNPEWITSYVEFAGLFCTLMLSISLLLAKWNKRDWLTHTLLWPLCVLTFPGILIILANSLNENFKGYRNFVFLCYLPFALLLFMLIINFGASI